ncbi:hypothetical protein BGZ61DRAFT_311964, partial [Ilyonectria robusta]|uniref:uncharacterized protein n=1 Tax=Ilyonectria robusta TaxID=1079257 RepID=UPI001E8E6850
LDVYTEKFRAQAGKELENCCFQNVKAFLLRAYLDALRGKLESATIFNSIACAMAKRLGLHVDCTAAEAQASIPSPQQTRERLAIFWATLWFDRRLAILEGRACHIDHVDISSPRPLEQMKAKDNYPGLPLSLELVYAFSHASTKEDATSEGHLNYISWFSSLPNTMKDISNGKPFHPSFLSFHIGFHAGLILLHRTSLNEVGRGAELSNQRCRESAATITTLLKSYYGHFKESVADPMVLHAAFTAALVHLVLLLDPDIVTYRSSLKALRSTTRILSEFSHTSPYAANILTDLQEFATRWSILPANSPKFW